MTITENGMMQMQKKRKKEENTARENIQVQEHTRYDPIEDVDAKVSSVIKERVLLKKICYLRHNDNLTSHYYLIIHNMFFLLKLVSLRLYGCRVGRNVKVF